MTVEPCTHECHNAGMALCFDCQDHPAHAGEPKFEGDVEQVEFDIPAPEPEQ